MSNETFKDNHEHVAEELTGTHQEQDTSSKEVINTTPELDVEQIRNDLEDVERPLTPELTEQAPVEKEDNLPPPNKVLKAQTLRATMKQTRKKLSTSEKVVSKVIHQPQVDAISNLTGKTIARPSGMLFGGLFALIGSALYLFASYHYHFAYKYIAFTLFFVIGFIIGLIIEYLGNMFNKKKAK